MAKAGQLALVLAVLAAWACCAGAVKNLDSEAALRAELGKAVMVDVDLVLTKNVQLARPIVISPALARVSLSGAPTLAVGGVRSPAVLSCAPGATGALTAASTGALKLSLSWLAFSGCGGAAINASAVALVLDTVTIQEGAGALTLKGGSLTATALTLQRNTAAGRALVTLTGANVTISGLRMLNNTAGHGWAVTLGSPSSFSLAGSELSGNTIGMLLDLQGPPLPAAYLSSPGPNAVDLVTKLSTHVFAQNPVPWVLVDEPGKLPTVTLINVKVLRNTAQRGLLSLARVKGSLQQVVMDSNRADGTANVTGVDVLSCVFDVWESTLSNNVLSPGGALLRVSDSIGVTSLRSTVFEANDAWLLIQLNGYSRYIDYAAYSTLRVAQDEYFGYYAQNETDFYYKVAQAQMYSNDLEATKQDSSSWFQGCRFTSNKVAQAVVDIVGEQSPARQDFNATTKVPFPNPYEKSNTVIIDACQFTSNLGPDTTLTAVNAPFSAASNRTSVLRGSHVRLVMRQSNWTGNSQLQGIVDVSDTNTSFFGCHLDSNSATIGIVQIASTTTRFDITMVTNNRSPTGHILKLGPGGGMLLTNIELTGNVAPKGAVLYGYLYLVGTGLTFKDNVADTGLIIGNEAIIKFDSMTFIDNTVSTGVLVMNNTQPGYQNHQPVLQGLVISGSTLEDSGSAVVITGWRTQAYLPFMYTFVNARLENNWAVEGSKVDGAAMRATSAVPTLNVVEGVAIVDSILRNNSATGGGGAIWTGANTSITNTSIEGNYAAYGGAVTAHLCNLAVNRSRLLGNNARIAAQLRTVEHGDTCPVGAGGALCVKPAASVSVAIQESSITGNTARLGGAIFADTTQCTSGPCVSLESNNNVVDNTVVNGSGSILAWTGDSNNMNLYCKDGTTADAFVARSCSEWKGNAIGSLNYDTYGFGSLARSLQVQVLTDQNSNTSPTTANSSANQVTLMTSGTVLTALLTVRDAYGKQPADLELRIRILQESTDACQSWDRAPLLILGDTTQLVSLNNGTYNFTVLAVQPTSSPNDTIYSLYFAAVDSERQADESLPPGLLELQIPPCTLGQKYESYRCTKCGTSAFNIGQNSSCAACPRGSNCANSSGVLLPGDEYFQVSPILPQLVKCPLIGACSYKLRQSTLRNLVMDIQAHYLQGEMDVAVERLQEAQCDTGFTGTFCGTCAEDWARVRETCVECPQRGYNVVWLILAMVGVVLLLCFTVFTHLRWHQRKLHRMKTAGGGNAASRSDKDVDGSSAPDEKASPRAKELSSGELVALEPVTRKACAPSTPPAAGTVASKDPENGWAIHLGTHAAHPGEDVVTPADGWGLTGLERNLGPAGINQRRNKLGDCSQTTDDDSQEPVGMIVGLFKIGISYLQVMAMVGSLSLHWPQGLSSVFYGMDFISISTSWVPVGCLGNDPSQAAIGATVLAVVIPLAMELLAMLFWLTHALRKKHKLGAAYPVGYLSSRLILTTIQICYYLYPLVTAGLLKVFRCLKVDGPTDEQIAFYGADQLSGWQSGSYWTLDYSQVCYKGNHLLLMAIIGIPGLILFGVGVPLAFWMLLFRHRRVLDVETTALKYGFLYEEYTPRLYFWESVIMARKAALLVCTIYLRSAGVEVASSLQVYTASIITVVFLLLQEVFHPFKRPLYNRMERVSLFSTNLTLLLLCYLLLDLGEAIVTIITVLIFLLNFLAVLYFLYFVLAITLLWLKQLPMTAKLLSFPLFDSCWAGVAIGFGPTGVRL